MANNHQAKILTPEELKEARHPLPKSWTDAAGILKGKKRVDALKYQKQIRREWDRRSKELSRLLER